MHPDVMEGQLAYYDSFGGLVPVRVLRVEKGKCMDHITVRVTAHRGPYRRGEVLKAISTHVVPREWVRFRHGVAWIVPTLSPRAR